MELQLCAFLNSALGEISGQLVAQVALSLRKIPGTHTIGDWVTQSI
jgi:hypothetical protein